MYKGESSKKKVVEFDLEVCLLPTVEMIGMLQGDWSFWLHLLNMMHFSGIRRKRRNGDIWEFKRVCDMIFKATHL